MNDNYARRLFVVGCIALFATSTFATLEEDDRKYQPLIDKAVATGLPGVQAFVRQGAARWSGTAGFASLEKDRPMRPTDRIRLASLTKMMTSAVTLELVKLRRFQLSDRAVTLLPDGALDGIPNADEITVAQLLDHRSGLHNFNGENGEDFFRDLAGSPALRRKESAGSDERFFPAEAGTTYATYWTASKLVGYAKKPEHPPTSRPGEKMSYSSTGYIVLERIMEHREGKPFTELFREHLFAPLNMTTAGVEGGDLKATNIADSYARPERADKKPPSPFSGRKSIRPDGLVNLSAGLDHYNAWARGAGAVAASAEDLGKFMNAITTGRVAVMTNQAEQFARFKLKLGALFDWNGGSRGIQTTILHDPNRDLTVIVLTNASNAGTSSHEIAKQLLTAARNATL